MKKVFDFITKFDPAILGEMTPEELAEMAKLLSDVGGVIEKIRKESGQMLLTKFEGDGKVFGNWAVTRVMMTNCSKVDIEKARELGAVKEVIDTTLLGNIIKKGAKIEGVTHSFYPRITNLKEEK
jgi:hypothetical protein